MHVVHMSKALTGLCTLRTARQRASALRCASMIKGGDWFERVAIAVSVVGVCGGLFALYVLATKL